MHCEHHPCDCAHGVRGVDAADRRLARAAAQERRGEKRQRHAGEESRGQHDQRADRAAREVEQRVAGVVARQALHQGFHQAESQVVDRQRGERGEAHGELDPGERARRIRGIDAAANGEAAERKAEDEGGEHQLERVRRGAQHERQHPDPDDLVDERGEAGEERHRNEQRRGLRAARRGEDRRQRAGEEAHRRGDGEIEHAGAAQRARQARPGDEDEAARQHAERAAEAVREVEHRHRLARAPGMRAREAGAHQREGRAEQHRLRQDQRRCEDELGGERSAGPAERRQERIVAPACERDEKRMEDEREHADRALGERVDEQRIGDARRAARAQRRAGGHAAHEDRQHERLRVRRVAEIELQVMRPDRLVDQAGEARYGEQDVERAARHGRRC